MSLRTGTASQLIDVDDEFNSKDDPLRAELQRQRQLPLSLLTSAIQIRGWIQYQQLTRSIKSATPSPPPQSLPFSPLPELRTPSPFADLNLTPLLSPSSIPSIASLIRTTSAPPPPPLVSHPKRSTAPSVSLMTSPTKKRPRRDAVQPRRYRNS